MPLPNSQVTIASYYPPSGSVVSISTIPFIVFSAPVNSSSIIFNVTNSTGNIVPSTHTYNSGIFTYTIVPNQNLISNQNYNGVFASGLDITGTGFIAGLSWPFVTNYQRTSNVSAWGWGASC